MNETAGKRSYLSKECQECYKDYLSNGMKQMILLIEIKLFYLI